MKKSDDIYFLSKFQEDIEQEVELDQSSPWMQVFLDELNEELDASEFPKVREDMIKFSGVFKKVNESKHGDVLTVTGQLVAEFYTHCVKTGKVLLDGIDVEIEAIFLDSYIKNKFHYEDEVDIFLLDRTWDLFYYEAKKVDLKPVFHEYLFLNKDPYPKIDHDDSDE